jgi:hypothetical protein
MVLVGRGGEVEVEVGVEVEEGVGVEVGVEVEAEVGEKGDEIIMGEVLKVDEKVGGKTPPENKQHSGGRLKYIRILSN